MSDKTQTTGNKQLDPKENKNLTEKKKTADPVENEKVAEPKDTSPEPEAKAAKKEETSLKDPVPDQKKVEDENQAGDQEKLKAQASDKNEVKDAEAKDELAAEETKVDSADEKAAKPAKEEKKSTEAGKKKGSKGAKQAKQPSGKEEDKEKDDNKDGDDHDGEHKKDEDFIKQLNTTEESSDDHDQDDEDEDEGSEEEHEEPVEKYEDFSREELLKKLEEVVQVKDIRKIKTRVALIKVAFLKLTREEVQEKLNEFLKNGGKRDEYKAEPDPLMERFNEAFDVYKKSKAKFNEEQEVLKLRNLDTKNQILEELKELISSEESLKKTYDRFKELQTQWKEVGLVPSTEINNLWQNYHFLVEKFFDKVKISKELRDLDLKKNMEMKMELCEKAEELLLEPSIIKSFKQLQKYHEEWREIGPVPGDMRDEIWERFKTATDKINERRREHYNSLAQKREENLVKKNELCTKAESIASQEAGTIKEWQANTRQINDLFAEWKTLGPAPKKDNDEVWERFKTYLNTFFSNKKEYFSSLKQEQLNNFNLKLDICKQAEAVKDSSDWRETTRELIDLQKEWKKIGPVPRKHSDKIWKRFRAACDEFFERKSEHFGNLQKNEKENLGKKKELIKRVEEYKFGEDKSDNLQVLKDFQREWMDIGHVPIKEKDKVQKSFREAINKHMDALDIHSSEIRISDRPRPGAGRDRGRSDGHGSRNEFGYLTGKINKLKEDIQLWENNIGFLANSKRADVVKKEFEEKIEKAKEELELHIAKLNDLQEADD